jgi:hypothetical protein
MVAREFLDTFAHSNISYVGGFILLTPYIEYQRAPGRRYSHVSFIGS